MNGMFKHWLLWYLLLLGRHKDGPEMLQILHLVPQVIIKMGVITAESRRILKGILFLTNISLIVGKTLVDIYKW